jgi:hypothetical protein
MLELCKWVEFYGRFRGASFLQRQDDQTTRCNVPEDNYLHTFYHENLKSHQGTCDSHQVARVFLGADSEQAVRHILAYRSLNIAKAFITVR